MLEFNLRLTKIIKIMSKIRKPAVAGAFYPKNKGELNKMLDEMLTKADVLDSNPKAIIAPHAGYIYSGQIAASAYKPLAKLQDKIKKIVLFGPSHRVAFNGLAVPKNDIFETPLGNIKIDQENIKLIKDFPQISISDEAHAQEHSLEVHLPFLQKIFGDNFELTPIVVGSSNAVEIGEIIEKLWGDEETLIVISTDLSHFHSYDEAFEIDVATCKDVVNLNLENLESSKMCGFLPVSGLLNVAKNKNLQVKIVDFCNSGDVLVNNQPTDQNRVVGYASFYCGNEQEIGNFISKPHKKELLEIARGTIEYSANNNYEPPEFLETVFDFDRKTPVATFVTLKINGKLRGCIGALEAHRDILQDVAFNAYSAAFSDPRFPKVTIDEVDDLEISISILTTPKDLKFNGENDLLKKIRPNIDGLILTCGNNRGTFLPAVWEDLKNKKDFLEHLKMKAGLEKDFWSDTIKIQRYETVKFDESLFY